VYDTQRREEQAYQDSHVPVNRREHVVQREVGEVIYGTDTSELIQIGSVERVRVGRVRAEALRFDRRIIERKVSAARELVLDVYSGLCRHGFEDLEVVVSLMEGVEPDHGADGEDGDGVRDKRPVKDYQTDRDMVLLQNCEDRHEPRNC